MNSWERSIFSLGLFVTAASCSLIFSEGTGQPVDAGIQKDAGNGPDGTIAVTPDANLGCSWGPTSLFVPCDEIIEVAVDQAFSLQGTETFEYNTDTGKLFVGQSEVAVPTQTLTLDGAQVPVIVVGKFTIEANATLRAVGTNPLLIVSWSELIVAGTIDVSSNNLEAGAASGDVNCISSGDGAEGIDGGGGGGGGGYGALGGVGGKGQRGMQAGGTAGGVAPPVSGTLRGGCPGGAGGIGIPDSDANKGLGGRGGGAVQLIAKSLLDISGQIHAGGQGGGMSMGFHTGGGGGGSGGLIRLEADGGLLIQDTAVIAANGGGGGGAGNVANLPGEVGEDGRLSVTPALGGVNRVVTASMEKGGNGGALGSNPGDTGDVNGISDNGGGGGGGGVGIIQFDSGTIVSKGTVSPAPST